MFGIKKTEAAVLALIAVIYLTVLLISPQGFWIIDEGNKYLWAQNLIEKGDFRLPDRAFEISPDASAFKYPFSQKINDSGDQITTFSPIFIVLISPLAALGGMKLALLLPLIIGLLLVFTLKKLALRLNLHFDALQMAIFALASPFFFYSLTIWEHGLAILIALYALLLSFAETSRVKSRIAAGALFALSVFIRPEMAIFALCAWLFLLKRKIGFLYGAFAGTLILIAVNFILTGYPLPLNIIANFHIKFTGAGIADIVLSRLDSIYALLLESSHIWYLSLGIITAAVTFFILPGVCKFIFPIALLVAVIASFFDSAPFFHIGQRNSLLYTAPFYFVSLFLASKGKIEKDFKVFAFAVILLTILLTPVFRGIHFGPRLLLSILPILALLSAGHLNQVRKDSAILKMDALYALIAVQLLASAASIILLQQRRQANLERYDAIMAQSRPAIISPQWWLQQEIPNLYWKRDFFLIETPLQLKEMLIDYYREGVRFFTLLVNENQPDEMYRIFNACPPQQIGAFKVDVGYPSMNLVGLNYAIGFDAKGAAKLADELGVYFGQIGDLPKSEEYLTFASKWDSSVDKYHFNLGYCLGQQKKYREALEELETAADLEPENGKIVKLRDELQKFLNESMNE